MTAPTGLPIKASGGGLTINFTQIFIQIAIMVGLIFLLAKLIKFQIVDGFGQPMGRISPQLAFG